MSTWNLWGFVQLKYIIFGVDPVQLQIFEGVGVRHRQLTEGVTQTLYGTQTTEGVTQTKRIDINM
jgi:hypothetical protein